MCMIVDANVIPCVFSSKNEKHNDFKPVLQWLLFGKAKLILGGKLWTKEIVENQKSYVPFLIELKRINKVHFYDNAIIDSKEKEVKSKEQNPDFDDPHIIALSIISKAKLLCSDDSRSFKFIRKIKEYDSNSVIPKIYTSIDHSPHTELLCDNNICSNGEHEILDKRIATLLFNKIEGIT